jgi:hypothetical protein
LGAELPIASGKVAGSVGRFLGLEPAGAFGASVLEPHGPMEQEFSVAISGQLCKTATRL